MSMRSINPLSKLGILDPKEDWVELAWWMTQDDNNKRVYLHHKMYGRSFFLKGKEYYYDGILRGWKMVKGKMKRVKLHDFLILGQAHIVIPQELKSELGRILLDLEIDHRWHPYMPRKNLVIVH